LLLGRTARLGSIPFQKQKKKKKTKLDSIFSKKKGNLAPCERDDRVARGAGEAGRSEACAGGGSGV